MPKPDSQIIKVAVVGALGKMGREVVKTIAQDPNAVLVAAVDRHGEGQSCRDAIASFCPDIPLESKLGAALDREQPHVLIEFSHPGSACAHSMSALQRGIAVVIGTSGLSNEDCRTLTQTAKEQNTPCMLVPNFAIGAVLMMKFAQLAARWMPHVEVLEIHHEQKADAPSGTAKATAELIAEARKEVPENRTELLKVPGVRGGLVKDVPVHSLRLPGFVASQEVVFGAQGESLKIRHDSIDRASFMGGVKLCYHGVWGLEGFVVGLDALLKD